MLDIVLTFDLAQRTYASILGTKTFCTCSRVIVVPVIVPKTNSIAYITFILHHIASFCECCMYKLKTEYVTKSLWRHRWKITKFLNSMTSKTYELTPTLWKNLPFHQNRYASILLVSFDLLTLNNMKTVKRGTF